MKYVTSVRSVKSNNVENATFIILGALYEYREKNLGVKSLLKYNNKLLIEHQVENIKGNFSNPEIIFISGFEHNKILKHKRGFRIVENVTYFDSGEFEQIRIGLQNAETDNIFIINNTTTKFDFKMDGLSKVYCSNTATNNPGCNYNKYVEHISYGIGNYITNSFFVCGNELELLKKYLIENKEKKYKLFMFEVINDLISRGAKFKAEDVQYENFNISR